MTVKLGVWLAVLATVVILMIIGFVFIMWVAFKRRGGHVTRATKLYNWVTAGIVAFVLALVGFIILIGALTGEYWCLDRFPPWGPRTDPTSECTLVGE